jgi:UDP-N-acetylmuramoylalanine--D-glutamate ligase
LFFTGIKAEYEVFGELQKPHVLVLGLGESGLAMARWCGQYGCRLRVADTREAPANLGVLQAELPAAEFVGGALSAALLDTDGGHVDVVAISPGLSPLETGTAALLEGARERGIPVWGEIELFARALAHLQDAAGYAPRVLAITGTNGKTTTTALTGRLVERAGKTVAVAGNISPSALDKLSACIASATLPDVWVLELSSFQLETMFTLAPHAATVLNVTQDHLDWHGGMAAYAASKARVFGPADGVLEAPAVAPVFVAPAAVESNAAAEASADPSIDGPAEASDGRLDKHLDEASVAVLDEPLAEAHVHSPDAMPTDALADAYAALDAELPMDASAESAAAASASAPVRAAPPAQPVRRFTVQVLNRNDAMTMAMARKGHPLVTFGVDLPETPDSYGVLREGGMPWLVLAEPDAEAEAQAKPRRRKAAIVGDAAPVPVRHKRLMPADALHIRGMHNATNAMAALALCRAIGLPLNALLHGLREYRGEPHRVEWVATIDDVEYVDDSKGTNVGATVAALSGLDKRVILIAGGEGKGQDFSPLAAPVGQYARAVVLIGKAAGELRAALEGSAAALVDAASLEDAVSQAARLAESGDVVLLSPACASFDMFRNYVHRAEVFRGAVEELALSRGILP